MEGDGGMAEVGRCLAVAMASSLAGLIIPPVPHLGRAGPTTWQLEAGAFASGPRLARGCVIGGFALIVPA